MFYRWLRPILFAGLEPERAHHMAIWTLGRLGGPWGAGSLVATRYAYYHPGLKVNTLGLDFANPIGLAAGFDKDGVVVAGAGHLGFGHIEVGTVTPRPQPGNPRPRLFRRPLDQAIVNRMGFNNGGAAAMANHLHATRQRFHQGKGPAPLIGINLGRNRDTPNEQAVEDYVSALQTLSGLGDYYVLNLSSPNTPGLRDLQTARYLRDLVSTVMPAAAEGLSAGQIPPPVLLKVGPDLSSRQVDDVVQVAADSQIAGLVATNTLPTDEGGLSGRPLTEPATRMIAALYRRVGSSLPIIGVGGVFDGRDAYQKIRAGASLIQLYTGLIYRGPGVAKAIKQELVTCMTQDGLETITSAVGLDAHRWPEPLNPSP